MKINSFFTALLCFLGFVTHGLGQVPSLINYQGRLADANGAPVTGSKNFTLSIYDGETEGGLLYSEDIGAVTLDDNGVYSFQFGESGTSQATATKSVGVADGVENVFNTVLPEEATGIVSITDGTYIWTPEAGSTAPTSFIGSYDGTSKTASAIYIGAAPEAGTEISVNYQNSTGGIAEALGSGLEHWLELSIDGANEASRTKILAVPFAKQSATAYTAAAISGSNSYNWRPEIWSPSAHPNQMRQTYPIYQIPGRLDQLASVECIIPQYFARVDQIRLSVWHTFYRTPETNPAIVKIIEITPSPYAERVIFTSNTPSEIRENQTPFNKNVILQPNIELQTDKIYKIRLEAYRYYSRYGTITSFNVIGKTTPHN